MMVVLDFGGGGIGICDVMVLFFYDLSGEEKVVLDLI